MSKLRVVLVASVLLFWLLAGVYGLLALGASFAASAACLRAARGGSRRYRAGTTRSSKQFSRVGLVVAGALVMSPAFLLAALIARPTAVETLTLRAAGIGSYLTNDAGERISGNRYTLMGAVIESCTAPGRAGHR